MEHPRVEVLFRRGGVRINDERFKIRVELLRLVFARVSDVLKIYDVEWPAARVNSDLRLHHLLAHSWRCACW